MLKLNSEFKSFESFLQNIREFFDQNQNTIHKARNEIKVINHNGLDVVVKSFKVPNILNRLIYTFFRSSKAKKSYDYALKIGSFTPKPIGYIEFFESGLLNDSYFVSEKFDYSFTIREPLLEKNFPNKDEIFKAFARFSYSLHENEIYHLDFSPGNILIKEENGNYIFKIVDINRMRFRPLCNELRMKNFSKLWAKDEDLKIIIKEYAKVSGMGEDFLMQKALKLSHSHKAKINFKKRLKGIEVVD
ncbi:MAG: lipopolysaccharide kinase InaA family protein [Sulfurimonas sp.]|nr:lipopolysaccharide kinase InaA family protein [Sulfurimonadaceae bacterium]